MADSGELERRARAWGVAASYLDARGERRMPGAPALRRIVEALRSRFAAAHPPQVCVLRRGRGPLTIPAPAGSTWRLVREGRDVAAGVAQKGAIVFDDLPLGSYHLSTEGSSAERIVLVAPERAYCPPALHGGRRLWGLAAQLYSLRSARNWGIGDFTDLAALVRIAGEFGAACVALNPLHALFLTEPASASPYSPSSRLFLNPLYIDVDAVTEFPGAAALGLTEALAHLRAADLVDYAGVAAAKTRALRAAYERFRARASEERRHDFAAFRQERGAALERFAAFETLRARLGSPWWRWPEEWRSPRPQAIAELSRTSVEPEYHAYLQWLADRQLAACADTARRLPLPLGLYLDMAVGVETDSADVWSNQAAHVPDLSVGAPPDLYNPPGQNWGLAPFHPGALAASDFDPFAETLRAAMRYAGVIRLDHVLGLNRLFLIPKEGKPADGTYVSFPFEAMLAIVAQESAAAQSLVIGEDLGTVPEGFRDVLEEWNVWSYRVMLFERDGEGAYYPPSHYPAGALATFSTHDLPTFAAWLSGDDLRVKRGLGLDPGESDEERAAARAALARALARECGEDISFAAIARFLARTPSRLLVLSMEDILGEIDQPNIPGTTEENPNWRRRLHVRLEEFAADPRVRELASVLAAEGRSRHDG